MVNSWAYWAMGSMLAAILTLVFVGQYQSSIKTEILNALDNEDKAIIQNKTQAIHAYLDRNNLRFENDSDFSVTERLNILQDRGVIPNEEAKIRIMHDLNAMESEAGKALEDNVNDRISLILLNPYDVTLLIVIMGIGGGLSVVFLTQAMREPRRNGSQ